MGMSLYRLCIPNAFGGRAGFDMNASHVFPQGVLAAITVVGGGLEMKGLQLGLGVRWGFPSAQWLSPLYRGGV